MALLTMAILRYLLWLCLLWLCLLCLCLLWLYLLWYLLGTPSSTVPPSPSRGLPPLPSPCSKCPLERHTQLATQLAVPLPPRAMTAGSRRRPACTLCGGSPRVDAVPPSAHHAKASPFSRTHVRSRSTPGHPRFHRVQRLPWLPVAHRAAQPAPPPSPPLPASALPTAAHLRADLTPCPASTLPAALACALSWRRYTLA
eukprot:scaffold20864_cov72-Phaeocystis_antarctica.AAC.6